jgi:Aspartyl/Asparaginyl beta-hydroxylase
LKQIIEGVKVEPILAEISDDLWNQITLRTAHVTSPHRECDDIWLRFRGLNEREGKTDTEFCNTAYTPTWYPCMDYMPITKMIIESIFMLVDGEELGGCLITRIPAGKQVYSHSDSGGYNCEHYLSKYLLVLQSAPGQVWHIGGKDIEHEAGSVSLFDNRQVHSVTNDSDVDRISLIITIRQKGQKVNV